MLRVVKFRLDGIGLAITRPDRRLSHVRLSRTQPAQRPRCLTMSRRNEKRIRVPDLSDVLLDRTVGERSSAHKFEHHKAKRRPSVFSPKKRDRVHHRCPASVSLIKPRLHPLTFAVGAVSEVRPRQLLPNHLSTLCHMSPDGQRALIGRRPVGRPPDVLVRSK